MRYVHTNLRVRDIAASRRFYEALGYERRGRLQFEGAHNVYLGLPGRRRHARADGQRGREEPYHLGEGYGHIALEVEDLDGLLASLAGHGIEPEKPPYHPGGREELRICFVADPDGYRVELIDGTFETPQDPEAQGERMQFLIRFDIQQLETISNQELIAIWDREADAALGAMDAGAVTHLRKVAGQRVVVGILELPDAESVTGHSRGCRSSRRWAPASRPRYCPSTTTARSAGI